MKFKKLASSVVASMMIVSNVALANEVDTIEKIEDVEETTLEEVDSKEESSQESNLEESNTECEAIKKAKETNNSRSATNKESEVSAISFGDKIDVVFPNKDRESLEKVIVGKVTIPSKGFLDIKSTVADDSVQIKILDKRNDVVEDFELVPGYLYGDEDNRKDFVSKTALKAGEYTIVACKYASEENNVQMSFDFEAVSGRMELEDNDSINDANKIELGKTYRGVLNREYWYQDDFFEVELQKDTNVTITIKEKEAKNMELKGVIYSYKDKDPFSKRTEQKLKYVKGVGFTTDITLKKGYHYIGLNSVRDGHGYFDYTINVSEFSGPHAPNLYTVGDSRDYISGTTVPGTSVYVKYGSNAYKKATVNNSTGYFKVKIGKMKAGVSVSAYAIDADSVKSRVVKTVCKDTTGPTVLEVEKILETNKYIAGKTEPNAYVVIGTSPETADNGYVKADSNGNFDRPVSDLLYPDLYEGKSIYLDVFDAAGNRGPIKTVKVQKYIAAPKVNNFSNINVTLTGTAPKGTTVYVKVGSKYYKGKVNSSGKFSIKIPKQKYKTVLKVYAKNSKGSTSKVVSKKVGYAPKKPTLNKVTTKSTKITGKSSKNAQITVKIGKKTYTGKTTSKGNFSIKIPKQKKRTKITVQAKFASTGLKSYTTSTTVK